MRLNRMRRGFFPAATTGPDPEAVPDASSAGGEDVAEGSDASPSVSKLKSDDTFPVPPVVAVASNRGIRLRGRQRRVYPS